MSYATKAILRDLNNDPIPQYFDVAADVFKSLSADDAATLKTQAVAILAKIRELELYGATTATRPAADAVAVGTLFYAITAKEATMSNGTSWEVQ